MLNKQINELPSTTVLTNVDMLVVDRFLGSGFYGSRNITVKDFKDTVTYPPPYDLGTVVSGSINVAYNNGFIQKALIGGDCTLNVPADGTEGKTMQFIFTTNGGDRLLDFSSSYGRAANVGGTFPVTLKANTVTIIQTYRNATGWIVTYIGTDTNVYYFTYDALKTIIANNSLVSGKWYKIIDFELKWNDSTTINLGLGTVVRSSGVVESLMVLATSSNSISPEAYSELNPNDIIYYDINATYSVGWGTDTTVIPNFKGWIYRRIDTVKNIDIGWDWRYIKSTCYKYDFSGISNWNSATTYTKYTVGSPSNSCVTKYLGKIYYSILDGNINKAPNTYSSYWTPISNSNETNTYFSLGLAEYNLFDGVFSCVVIPAQMILQPTFTSSITSSGISDISTTRHVRIGTGYNNVIIGSGCQYNTIGNDFISNTIDINFKYNVVGDIFRYNLVGSLFAYNASGVNVENNIISFGFTNNTIVDTFNNNLIGGSTYGNDIGSGFVGNVIGGLLLSNNIGNNFSNNTLGSGLDGNTITNNFTLNIISNNFNNNNLGAGFTQNIIYDGFINNVIGSDFRLNNIGSGFSFNSIGNSFYNNTVGDSCDANSTSNGFAFNTIGYNFQSNVFGNSCAYNIIGNQFSDNIISNNFYGNEIDDSFSANTVGNDFDTNIIGISSSYNTIGSGFSENTVGDYFSYNTIGGGFSNNEMGNNFKLNTIMDSVFSLYLVGATHVYNTYNCTISKGSDSQYWLAYYATGGILTTTSPTS